MFSYFAELSKGPFLVKGGLLAAHRISGNHDKLHSACKNVISQVIHLFIAGRCV